MWFAKYETGVLKFANGDFSFIEFSYIYKDMPDRLSYAVQF